MQWSKEETVKQMSLRFRLTQAGDIHLTEQDNKILTLFLQTFWEENVLKINWFLYDSMCVYLFCFKMFSVLSRLYSEFMRCEALVSRVHIAGEAHGEQHRKHMCLNYLI